MRWNPRSLRSLAETLLTSRQLSCHLSYLQVILLGWMWLKTRRTALLVVHGGCGAVPALPPNPSSFHVVVLKMSHVPFCIRWWNRWEILLSIYSSSSKEVWSHLSRFELLRSQNAVENLASVFCHRAESKGNHIHVSRSLLLALGWQRLDVSRRRNSSVLFANCFPGRAVTAKQLGFLVHTATALTELEWKTLPTASPVVESPNPSWARLAKSVSQWICDVWRKLTVLISSWKWPISPAALRYKVVFLTTLRSALSLLLLLHGALIPRGLQPTLPLWNRWLHRWIMVNPWEGYNKLTIYSICCTWFWSYFNLKK